MLVAYLLLDRQKGRGSNSKEFSY